MLPTCRMKTCNMVTVLLGIVLVGTYFMEDCLAATFNAALGKEASQSTIYTVGTEAGKAVDGNLNPVFNALSCATTAYNDYAAWWEVDLGRNYHVAAVIITNRLTSGQRLHDFTVALAAEPDGSRTVCLEHPGAVAAGATVTLSCDQITWGRFVRLTKLVSSSMDVITLCEVQVMAVDRSRLTFQRLISATNTGSFTVTMTTDLPSCAHTCKDADDCMAINYNSGTNQCQLYTMANITNPTVNSGWECYTLLP